MIRSRLLSALAVSVLIAGGTSACAQSSGALGGGDDVIRTARAGVAREAAPPRPQPRLPEPVQELTVAPPLRPEPQPAAFSPPPPLPPRPAAPQPSAPAAAAAPAPAPAPRVDPDYADIHAKMEAALRNTMAASTPRAPQPATPPRPAAPPAPPPPMPQTRAMPASPAPAVSQPVVQKTPATDAPNPFDSLEAEMASLLGQDKKR